MNRTVYVRIDSRDWKKNQGGGGCCNNFQLQAEAEGAFHLVFTDVEVPVAQGQFNPPRIKVSCLLTHFPAEKTA